MNKRKRNVWLALAILTSVATAAVVLRVGCSIETRPSQALPLGLAPSFELTDQNGQTVRLVDKLKAGPAVVVFYRGYW